MASIIRAADGQPGIPAGFPILLTDRMEIIEPAFAFLLELATIPGRSHSLETLRTYAEHLYDWFDSLEQSDLDWQAADEAMVAAYRNRMLEQPSAHTGRPYARSTINDRVRSVCRFYDWAHRRGWVTELSFHMIDVRITSGRKQSLLAHADARAMVTTANVLTVAEFERLPRPLRVDQLARLFAHLAMPYRLTAEWAIATGMRRMELCALTVAQLPETVGLDAADHPLIGLPLAITKGDRPRTVYPPIRLVDRTHWYVGEERAALVRRMHRTRSDYRSPSTLFLNRNGAAVTRAHLSAVFAAAFAAAELDGTLHWLRHTFAMTMLARLQALAVEKPEINPLKVLQVLLGHSSIHTTAIYLRCMELHPREIAESIEYLYGEVVPDAV
ncbi:tyrosine-type recombinase/integrase [Rhizobium sp. MHM7A]|uniref:tyrosine-type recombinase/integrase n=1 Tax=Rhizobium sp. MHM7A TaxID=2583233 RepID=UPI001106D93D|nr:tyrosine-type recombinase/integrase [Rhizobium sp. MHM7A]TLW99318.1 transposase [Rhizobium sp. MHM7A]